LTHRRGANRRRCDRSHGDAVDEVGAALSVSQSSSRTARCFGPLRSQRAARADVRSRGREPPVILQTACVVDQLDTRRNLDFKKARNVARSPPSKARNTQWCLTRGRIGNARRNARPRRHAVARPKTRTVRARMSPWRQHACEIREVRRT